MEIYLFGFLLVALAVLLVVIVRRTLTMIRERRALLALGKVEWKGWQPLPEIDTLLPPEPEQTGQAPAADSNQPTPPAAPQSGAIAPSGAAREPASPAVPGTKSPSRRRQLVSATELSKPGERLWPMTPGYFKEVEGRLESAFEALCAEQIDLQRYIALVEKEYELAQRLQINLGPLADDDMHREASEVLSALAWCKDWALNQLAAQAPANTPE